MPRGGYRVGGGRPTKAQQAAKAALLAETIAKGPKTRPREYLQGLLDSPGSTKSERLRAAELLLKNGSASDAPSSASVLSLPPVILAIPRGCFLSKDQAANPDQFIPHGVPATLFKGTPGIELTEDTLVREPKIERLEITEIDTTNVTPLRRRSGDDDAGDHGPGAA